MIRKTNFYKENDLKLIGQAFPNVINIIGKPFEISFNIVHNQLLKIVCSKNVVFQMTKEGTIHSLEQSFPIIITLQLIYQYHSISSQNGNILQLNSIIYCFQFHP